MPGVTSTGAIGLSAAAFINVDNFVGFDFEHVWEMGDSYPVLRENPLSGDMWQPWSKLGVYDVWNLFSDQLHQAIPAVRVENPALLITASQSGIPLTDKQQITELSVALQAKLMAQESNSWNHKFIADEDVFIYQSSTGTATEGFNPAGFVMAAPSVSKRSSDAEWNKSQFLWPDTVHNAAFRFAIPEDGSGSIPSDFVSRMNTAWSSATNEFISPGYRRRMYQQTFLFGMFPEATPFNELSRDIKARYLEAFEAAGQRSSLTGAVQNGDLLTVGHLVSYLNEFADSLPDEDDIIAQKITNFALELAGVPGGVDLGITANNEAVVAAQKHLAVVEMMIIKSIQSERVQRRRDYLISSFGLPSDLPNGKWVTSQISGLDGWAHDPAILYGLADAIDTVDAILGADSSEEMALALVGTDNIWGAATEADAIQAYQDAAVTVVTVALSTNPVGQLALLVYKSAMLAYEVHIYLQGELLAAAEAINMMFCAGTVDDYLKSWGPGNSNSLSGVKQLQTRSNIRMLMAVIYYGSLLKEDGDNFFYVSLSEGYKTRLQSQYTASLNYVEDDYLMTYPVPASDALSLARAAYVTESVPGIINPPGQMNLNLVAGAGGDVTGGGFVTENALAPISATEFAGYRFSHWSGDLITDTSSKTTSVMMDQDKTVTAHFNELHTVTVVVSGDGGGSVSGGGEGISGESVSIEAQPSPGYAFVSWSGASGIASPGEEVTTVTTTSNKTVVASFVKQWNLTVVSANTTMGTVTSITNPVNQGSHAISAESLSGYRFDRWEGVGITDVDQEDTTINVTQDQTVTAHFLINTTDEYHRIISTFGDETDLAKIGPRADFDLDGKSNLLEYAYGLDAATSEPDAPVKTEQPRKSGSNIHGRFRFMVRSDDPELNYSIGVTSDLSGWTDINLSYDGNTWVSGQPEVLTIVTQTDLGDGLWLLVVEDAAAISDQPRFYRSDVTTPYD